jgi:hypothetical protein
MGAGTSLTEAETPEEITEKHERAATHHEQAALRHRAAAEKIVASIQRDLTAPEPNQPSVIIR